MNPDEILFHSNVAACYIEEKKFEDAIKACDVGIEKTKGTNYDYVKLAKVMARKASAMGKNGDIDAAVVVYEAALLENNDSKIKDEMKAMQKKQKEDDRLAYINPEMADAHKEAGNVALKAGDFPGAIKEYDEGLRRDPKNVALFSNRSQAYIKLMEPNQGMRDAEKVLALDPNFVKGWIRKGTCHQMMKEYHKAMEAFDNGLKLDPNSKECQDAKAKTINLIQQSSHASSGNDEERMQHAMADPEIQ